MLNEKFWNPEKNSYISSCIKEFIAGEPALAKLDSVKLGGLETKLFALLQKVKEPIYREVDEEYLREDVSDKIKEWCDEKGDYVHSLFSLEDIEALVNSWQNRLNKFDAYWEAYWDALYDVVEEEYDLSSLEEYSKLKIKEYLQYRFKQNGFSDELLSVEDYFKAKKKGEIS